MRPNCPFARTMLLDSSTARIPSIVVSVCPSSNAVLNNKVSSAILRSVMLMCSIRIRGRLLLMNRLTRPTNQRFCEGEWHEYSAEYSSHSPFRAARIAAANSVASLASAPVAHSHTAK